MGMMGTLVSMRPTSRLNWPTMRKRMVMVGRKTLKVSQVEGTGLPVQMCIHHSSPAPFPPPLSCCQPSPAFVPTVRVAHSAPSLVLKSAINEDTFRVKAGLLCMQFRMSNLLLYRHNNNPDPGNLRFCEINSVAM